MAILFARSKNLEKSWPFVPEALLERLNDIDEVQVVNVERGQPIGKAADLSKVSAIAMFGGQLTDPCLKSAPELKVVAGVFGGGYRNLAVDPIFGRDIAIIDATRGWATSVAEITLALTLNSLRMIPQWHKRMAARERLWGFEYAQFCDNPDFVNGTLGSKTVGVMGLVAVRNRINVVHTPHIAGRTRDANLRVAEVIASDIGRVLSGEAPQARSSREAIAVRGERTDLPTMK
jgi:phosphoglycerate dehydrogenase-like enzyme